MRTPSAVTVMMESMTLSEGTGMEQDVISAGIVKMMAFEATS
jgi:hypothetical protein